MQKAMLEIRSIPNLWQFVKSKFIYIAAFSVACNTAWLLYFQTNALKTLCLILMFVAGAMFAVYKTRRNTIENLRNYALGHASERGYNPSVPPEVIDLLNIKIFHAYRRKTRIVAVATYLAIAASILIMPGAIGFGIGFATTTALLRGGFMRILFISGVAICGIAAYCASDFWALRIIVDGAGLLFISAMAGNPYGAVLFGSKINNEGLDGEVLVVHMPREIMNSFVYGVILANAVELASTRIGSTDDIHHRDDDETPAGLNRGQYADAADLAAMLDDDNNDNPFKRGA